MYESFRGFMRFGSKGSEGSGQFPRIVSTWRIMGLSNWGYISKVTTVIITYNLN